MTLRHFLKRQNRSQNNIQEITVKSRNDLYNAFFACFVISQPFLKISTLNFVHILISHYPLTYTTVFLNKKVFEGEHFEKEKAENFVFRNFQNFESPE